MRAFLTKIEDFFARIGNKLIAAENKKKEKAQAENKKPGLFDRLDNYLAKFDGSFLMWSFFMSFAVMLLIYVTMDVYPFGKSSVLVLDLNGQYVQFFAGLRDILHGDGSLLYSFSRSLGGEFLGIFTYYLASPFSWLVAIFPEKNILEALLLMFVLKTAFCGLNFGIFLHYSRRPPKLITIALSVLYALSSYGIVMQHNTMWIDAMMLVPLVMLGLERLISKKKPILYVASLALVILCNYYIGYMICIFTAIYFFYYFLATDKNTLNPIGERHHFGKALLRVGVFSALALGIAAMLLLPAYYSLTFGKTDFSDGDFSFRAKFDLIDFFAKMFPGAYDTVRPEGLPWVYSGTISLILLPLYFAAKKIPVREKIATGALAFILFLSMYINTFDVLWHGGQAPNWLNYRYSFLFSFVILLIAARALTALQSVDYRTIIAVTGILMVIVVILQKLNLSLTVNGEEREYFYDLNGVWLSLGCLAIYGILLLFLNGHDRSSPRFEPIATILIGVICIETLLNGVFYLLRQHDDVVISSYASYHDYYDVYDAPIDYVKENDEELFYRMDTAFQHTVCDSFVLGYNGLASSTSTLNAKVVKFQHALGMKANSHWTEATGSTIATNALLGVKYWIIKDGSPIDPLYTEYHREGDAEAGTATITYLNPYALPIAFAANDAVKDITYAMPKDPDDYVYNTTTKKYELKEEVADALWSPFTRLNATYEALTGIDGLTVYDPIEATISLTGDIKQESSIWSHAVYKTVRKADPNARLTFTLVSPADDTPIYCYFPTRYSREAELYLNGEKMNRTIYDQCANIADVISLGCFPAGETVTVELTFEDYGEFYLVENTPYFYTIDANALATATDLLKEGGISLTKAEDGHLEGTMTAKDGFTTVQTTIPYDAGWRIIANGEEIEGYSTLDALLAFDLPEAGEYTITLKYRPTIYTFGLVISILSIAIVGGVLVLIILRKKGTVKLEGKNPLTRVLLFFLPELEEKKPAVAGDADSSFSESGKPKTDKNQKAVTTKKAHTAPAKKNSKKKK